VLQHATDGKFTKQGVGGGRLWPTLSSASDMEGDENSQMLWMGDMNERGEVVFLCQ
jgi:hypothetical protein